MPKIEEAQVILKALGLPPQQQNDMAALTFLALCGLRPDDTWASATRRSLTITKGVMAFVAREYGRQYAPNTRETFRRQVLHQFIQARVVDYNPDEPGLPTNSPRAHYALSESVMAVVRSYGKGEWSSALDAFISQHGHLLTIYQGRRTGRFVPLHLPDGVSLQLSPGRHNELQRAVIEQFAPRFAPGASVLYLGDTAAKSLYMHTERLSALSIPVGSHDKLPDVILYNAERRWLFLIEAVTSHGPVTPKRHFELEAILGQGSAARIYVSAFPRLVEFRKYLNEIAWETEVWIADMPDHLIHFNGDRFLGPR